MKKLSLLLALLCINLSVFANVNAYTFARTSGTYTPLSSGTPLIPPNSSITGTGWFQQVYRVPLPFVFFFNGIGYSNVLVNSNGYLAFGNVNNGGTYPFPCNAFPFFISAGQSGSIAGYSSSSTFSYTNPTGGSGALNFSGLIDNSNSNPILYATTGTAPNRKFIVQWTAAQRTQTFYNSSGTGSENLTFQIALSEGTNVVDIIYNTSICSYTTALNIFPGLVGSVTSDFYVANGTAWATSSGSTSSVSGIPFSSSQSIPAGTTFTFTPPAGLMPAACSGTPSTATAVANVGIAAGGPVSLGLNGISLATGLTFQWQYSPTGISNSWTNISGATNASLITTPTASGYYQCLVACGSGTSIASTAVSVGYESSYPTLPSYTYNTSFRWASAHIGLFSIAGGACGTTLSDANSSLPTYNYTAFDGTAGNQYNLADYTGNSTHIKLQGSTSSTTSFTATINNIATNNSSYGVWIDINDNGVFESTELVGGVDNVLHVATNFTITIPANNFGIHRMRVRGAYSGFYSYTTMPASGSALYFGITKDYKVEIIPPTPVATNNSPLCAGGTVLLNAGALTGALYSWTGPLSYYSTTSSTTQSYTVPSTSGGGTYSLYTTVNGSNACSAGTTVVTVNPVPTLTSASNTTPVCSGNSFNLVANGAANVTGYSWAGPATISSATSATASVSGATTAASGTYTVTVNNGTGSGCTANYTTTATVNPLPVISGANTVCTGSTTTLSSTSTVTWSSSNTAVATVGASTGVVTGVSVGAVNITCGIVSTGCISVQAMTVNPLPAAIGANVPFCPGSSNTFTDATAGGVWTSGNTSLATIGSSTGTATGVLSGNPVISYTLPATGCYVTAVATVISTPAITGSLGVCAGFTSTLSNPIPGGTWASNNTAVATIGSSSGVVTGVSAGTAVITYTFPSTCTITATVGVTSTPITYTVSGGGPVCAGTAGAHIYLSGSQAGVAYQVYVGGTPTGSPVSGTGLLLDLGTFTIPGIYTVVANPGSPCAATMASSASISVNAAPTVFSVSGGGGYCAGGTGVHIYLSGSQAGITYQLMLGAGTVGGPMTATGTILDFGLLTAAGTYTVTATNTTTGCTSNMTSSATVTVNPLPAVYTVTGTGGYCTGDAGRTVGLSGSDVGITYQLYRGGVAIGSGVAGTGSALSFGLQTVAGSYTVIATNNTTGCVANMTGAANITVNPLPTIFNVTGGGSFCSGGTGAGVGLGGSQSGVNYQLYRNGVATGSPVAGSGAAISFGNQTVAGIYTVGATHAATTCTVNMIGSATVVVNPLPVVYGVIGGGAYCAGGAGLAIGLTGSEVGVSYRLYRDGILVDAASGTTAPLNFGLHTIAGTYTIDASVPSTGCTTTMSGSAIITINPLPTAFSVTGGGGYCDGGTGLPVGLSSSQSGVNYAMTCVGDSLFLVGPVAGTGGALNFGTFKTAGTYTVLAISTVTGCGNIMSGSAVIVKNPLPTPYAVTGGGNYCTGGTGVSAGLSNSNTGISYQLLLGGTPSGSPVVGTGSAISFGLRTGVGTYTVRATNTVTGCINMMSGSTTINTIPLPTAYAVTGGGNYCAGGAGVPVGLTNSATGVNYQLYQGTTATGSAVAGTTGAAISFGLLTSAGTYTVKATEALYGCVSTMSGSAVVVIDPLPAAFNVTGGGNYCAGGTGVAVGLSNSATGVNYQLYNGGSTVGAAMSGSGFALDFGMMTATGNYTVKATNATSGCYAMMNGSAMVNTNTLPVAYAVTGGGNLCAGGAGVHVGLVSSDAGMSYQLYNGASAVGAAVPGSGGAIDLGAQTTGGIYTVKATNTATGCVSTMLGSATIIVNPLPAAQIVTGGGNYCVGGMGLHIGLSGSQTGVDYQLYNGSIMVGVAMAGSGSALDYGFQTGTGTYTVVATNTATGCSRNMGGAASIAMSTAPTMYSVTGANYCPLAPGASVKLSNSDIGVSYQVYNSSSVAVGTSVAGTGTMLDMGIFPAGNYTVIATGSGTGCVGSMYGTATININSVPAPNDMTGGGSYCSGGTGVAVGIDGSAVGNSYQLYRGGIAVGSAVAGTGAAIDFGLQTTAGLYSVVATDNVTMCTSNMTGTKMVIENALPGVFNVSGGGNYCSGGAGVHVFLNGSEVGVDYQLYNGISPVVVLPGTGSSLDFGPQTAGGNYTVMATNSTTGCGMAMGASADVVVNPSPTAYNVGGGGNFCVGGSGAHITLASSQTGVSYQLFRDGITSVGLPVAGAGTMLDFGLQTTSGAYTVVATNVTTSCVNTMTGSATITAMPLPVIYTVSGSSAGYCAGSAGVSPILSGSEYGVNYQLYRGATLVGPPMPGSGGSITFAAQTNTGSYTVVGTNAASGCTSNMMGGATIAVYPVPVTYTVTGGGSYCNGGSGVHVGLSGSAIGTNYQLIIGGAPGPIMAGTGSAIDFGLQTTGGYYTVKATNTTGCTANMTGSASVLINALPAVVNVTGGGNYCSGGTGVNIGLSGSVMGIKYQLANGMTPVGLAISGTGSPISFGLQTAAGSYTVTATNTTTGCSNVMTGSATIGINPSPASFTVAGGGGYCAGGAGVHVGLINSATGVTYRLYRGTTLIGTPTAGTGTPIDLGIQTVVGTYTITGTDGTTGCMSNMTGSASVVVNALPAVYAVTGGGNFCAGSAGVHIGLSNSQPGVNYDLMLGASSVATMAGSGSSIDFGSIATAGNYTVQASNATTGCIAAMTGSATVFMDTVVVPSVTISTGVGDTVCTGMLANFAAMTVNAGATPSYIWTVNGITVTSTSGSYSYFPLDGDIVGVRMTSSAACATPAAASATMRVHVNTPQMPSVTVAVNPGTNVCQGSVVSMTAVPAFGGSTPVYQWIKNGIPTGVTSETYSYTPANGDAVKCILYSGYRCRLRDSAISAATTLTVSVPSTPGVTISANPGLTISAGTPLALTATATNAGASPTYQWKVNGVAITGAVGETYINNEYRNMDQVMCEVSSSGVCAGTKGSSSVIVRLIGVGIHNVNAVAADVKLLPNPNKGIFMLKGTWGTITEDATVEITNMLGQSVYTDKVSIDNGVIDARIQLNNVANGMYLLTLRSGKESTVFHLVVEQ